MSNSVLEVRFHRCGQVAFLRRDGWRTYSWVSLASEARLIRVCDRLLFESACFGDIEVWTRSDGGFCA